MGEETFAFARKPYRDDPAAAVRPDSDTILNLWCQYMAKAARYAVMVNARLALPAESWSEYRWRIPVQARSARGARPVLVLAVRPCSHAAVDLTPEYRVEAARHAILREIARHNSGQGEGAIAWARTDAYESKRKLSALGAAVEMYEAEADLLRYPRSLSSDRGIDAARFRRATLSASESRDLLLITIAFILLMLPAFQTYFPYIPDNTDKLIDREISAIPLALLLVSQIKHGNKDGK